jgi:hypothetical protein
MSCTRLAAIAFASGAFATGALAQGWTRCYGLRQ